MFKLLRCRTKRIVALGLIPLSPVSFLKGCGGDGGSGHIIVGVRGETQETAVVDYLNVKCTSLEAKAIVGTSNEISSDSVEIEFSEIDGCTDVTVVPEREGTPVGILTECHGAIHGSLDDQTGLCRLVVNGDRCECEINAVALAESHNQDFAARMSEGIITLRASTEQAKDKVFEGLASPEEAEFEEGFLGDDSVYRFDCSLL